MSKSYNVFVSHSWNYNNEYENLIKLLEKDPYFNFKNYSVPKNDPIHNANNATELKQAIEKQIIPCSVILILAGVYASYSKWIDKEIEISKKYPNTKKIIAIEPYGAERTSKVVKDNAHKVVKWNSSSIIDAIKDLG